MQDKRSFLDSVKSAIFSKIAGDTGVFVIFGIVSFLTLDTLTTIWEAIPITERFGSIPWLLFIYTYYLCNKYEAVQVLKKERVKVRNNYLYTLYWIVIPLAYHYVGALRGIWDSPWVSWLFPFKEATMRFDVHVSSITQSDLSQPITIVGLLIAFWGVYYAGVSRVHLNGYWGLDVYDYGEGNKIISSGPYKKVRHPIYMGQNLLVLGTAMIFSSVEFYLFSCFVFYLNCRRSTEEENHLMEIVGDEYLEPTFRTSENAVFCIYSPVNT